MRRFRGLGLTKLNITGTDSTVPTTSRLNKSHHIDRRKGKGAVEHAITSGTARFLRIVSFPIGRWRCECITYDGYEELRPVRGFYPE